MDCQLPPLASFFFPLWPLLPLGKTRPLLGKIPYEFWLHCQLHQLRLWCEDSLQGRCGSLPSPPCWEGSPRTQSSNHRSEPAHLPRWGQKLPGGQSLMVPGALGNPRRPQPQLQRGTWLFSVFVHVHALQLLFPSPIIRKINKICISFEDDEEPNLQWFPFLPLETSYMQWSSESAPSLHGLWESQ